MKKFTFDTKIKKYLLISLLVFVFAPLQKVFAQSQDIVPCGGTSCTWCDFFKLVQNVVNFVTEFAVPLAMLAMLIAGAYYIVGSMTANRKTIDTARKTIANVFMGLLIVIGTFLIVNTTLMVVTGEGVDKFLDVDCTNFKTLVPGSEFVPPAPPSDRPHLPPAPEAYPKPTSGNTYGEQDARAALAAAGIGVNKYWAGSGKQPCCTDVAGFKPATMDGIMAFDAACNCTIMVTGGTEDGPHAGGPYSHEAGYKVDFALTDQTTNYIENTFGPPVGHRTDGTPLYRDAQGNVYAKETFPGQPSRNHWDIAFCGGDAACTQHALGGHD